jgi:hypothetical protein
MLYNQGIDHQPASSFYEVETGEFILETEELLNFQLGIQESTIH